jgi:hypothetical protein
MAYFSLHTADPGTTGASEVTGGSPAYARKAATPGTAASSAVAFGAMTFDVPSGAYTHWGAWSASTGGTFIMGGTLAATQSPGSQAQVVFTPTLTVGVS